MTNPYYSPESFGLEVLATADRAGSYEFDMLVVWRRLSDGSLWYATDSGCSCPSPFEQYTEPFYAGSQYRFKRIRTARGFARKVAEWVRQWEYKRDVAAEQATALLAKVEAALAAPVVTAVEQTLEPFVRSGELEGDLREAGYSKEQAEFVVKAVLASLQRNVPF